MDDLKHKILGLLNKQVSYCMGKVRLGLEKGLITKIPVLDSKLKCLFILDSKDSFYGLFRCQLSFPASREFIN